MADAPDDEALLRVSASLPDLRERSGGLREFFPTMEQPADIGAPRGG